LLLTHGANVNAIEKKDRLSALLFACVEGHEESVIELLKNNADPKHLKKSEISSLMYGARSGSGLIVKTLLEKGVDPNGINDVGQNALIYAADRDSKIDAVRELLKGKADPNKKDNEGKPVLFWAAAHGSIEIVRLLLENGAVTEMIDSFGSNVLDYARKAKINQKKIIELLKDHGVKKLPLGYGYSLQLNCPSCGLPVLPRYPVLEMSCHACRTKINLDENFWKEVFDDTRDSSGSVTNIGGTGYNIQFRRMSPVCPSCKNGFIVEKITDRPQVINCTHCGAKLAAIPAPDWLSDFKINGHYPVSVIYTEEFSRNGISSQNKVLGMTITCSSCGASLSINPESPRNALCQYCQTSNYLSDEVWFSLHPVPKRSWWYLLFEK